MAAKKEARPVWFGGPDGELSGRYAIEVGKVCFQNARSKVAYTEAYGTIT